MKTTAFLLCVTVTVGLSACGDGGGGSGGSAGAAGAAGTGGSTAGSSGNAGTGGGAATAGAAGATSSGGSGGSGAIDCSKTGAGAFPDFDKTCAAAADCVLKFHQINCCGTRDAIGINKDQGAAFDAAEMTCEMQYPGCGCAQQPTTAEDGKTAQDESMIMVDCKSGKCSSYVP